MRFNFAFFATRLLVLLVLLVLLAVTSGGWNAIVLGLLALELFGTIVSVRALRHDRCAPVQPKALPAPMDSRD